MFSSIIMPNLTGIKSGNIKVYISLPVEGKEEEDGYYQLDASFDEEGIHLNDYYYDFIDKKIKNSSGSLVKGVNFPVESFSLKVIFDDLGDSFSNFEVIKNYKNTEEFFGECEVSSFCFI